MRICLVYDHLFPQTVGGAERWMHDLAIRLAEHDHQVTYVTMRHWRDAVPPQLPGVHVLGLADPGRIYRPDRRTIGPPLRFGAAVAFHLARRGRAYDVVHLAAFPYFPLLAAGALRRSGCRIFVDWHEVWTRGYWQRYAGLLGGTIGWLVQRACIAVPHQAFCMSRLHAKRLVAEGYRDTPMVLPGLYAGPVAPSPGERVDAALVVYAGRHVREKRIDALVRAFARAAAQRSDLRLELYGDGPSRTAVERLAHALGVGERVRIAGRVPEEEVAAAFSRAACVATASEREGYGLIVVEAAAYGTPSVVVAGPENAATELVQDGVNGAVARDATPGELADALLRVIDAGSALRKSTAGWFAENARNLMLDRSVALVLDAYRQSSLEYRSPAIRSR